jgi:hypothetical protein
VNNRYQYSDKVATKFVVPWCRIVEELMIAQLVNKFPAVCGAQRFITVYTRVF